MPDAVRLDKWLWSVRLFKTRHLAAEACRLGRIEINRQPAKPARDVRPGDVIAVRQDFLTRLVRVKAVLDKRVGARLVTDFLDDLTPPDEIERARQQRTENRLASPVIPPGAGRPTKQQRRQLDAWRRQNDETSGS